jgi:hydrogenase assembly chaperone HypC/HupF
MMCLEAVGQVLDFDPDAQGIAIVQAEGRLSRVSLVMLDLDEIVVSRGDWLLAHTGLAIKVLAEDDAKEIEDQRRQMRAAYDQQAVFGEGEE